MIPDSYEREAALPVRIRRDGSVEVFYGGPLPALARDRSGIVRLPKHVLADCVHLTALATEV